MHGIFKKYLQRRDAESYVNVTCAKKWLMMKKTLGFLHKSSPERLQNTQIRDAALTSVHAPNSSRHVELAMWRRTGRHDPHHLLLSNKLFTKCFFPNPCVSSLVKSSPKRLRGAFGALLPHQSWMI